MASPSLLALLLWTVFLVQMRLHHCVVSGELEFAGNSSQQLFLFPSQGDLLIGRVPHLTASSTCGEVTPKVYCPIGQTKCFTCDSKHEWDRELNPNSHKIGNVVAKIRNSNTTYDSWWMSETGAENVTIQLDLDAKFTFTHLIMIFHSYRPKSWWLERSSDYGETYRPYGYFAEKCEEAFPWVKPGPRMQLDDVVCGSSYTEMTPSDRGQVVFNAIPQHISETDIFNEATRDKREFQTDITNLRIHLVKYHTLSDEKLSSDSSELSKYYFGLYEMNVHGMCICNGHALTCKPAEGVTVVDKNAVYGYCECMHNTQGMNCEECRDFYHDRKWAPATLTDSHECRRCQCFGHSNKCAFSQKKWDESGGVSGGVCLDCMHNTTGDNCQRCGQGFYRDEAKSLEDPDICAACECSSAGIKEAFCEPETDKARGLIAGHCHCKSNVGGRNCDRCEPGYWNLRDENPDGCQVCDCLLLGTTGNQGCNQYTGQCPCKANVDGEKCDRCKLGFFNLSQIDTGCSPCECDIGGSMSQLCHPTSGECSCKLGFGGRKCDTVLDRYYVPHFDIDGTAVDVYESPDSIRFPRVTKLEEPTLTGRGGLRIKSPTQRTPDDLVIPLRNLTVGLPPGEYDIALKVYPRSVNSTVELLVHLDNGRDFVNCTNRQLTLNGLCLVPATGEFREQQASNGGRPYFVKPIFANVCIDAMGLEKITILLFGVPSTDDIVIDAVVIGKQLEDPITYQLNKKASTGPSILPPFKIDVNVTILTSLYNCLDYWKPAKQQASQMPAECRRLVQSLSGHSLPGALMCSCDGQGSRSPNCEKIGGQCSCWPNIVGRTCNACAANHFGFGQFSTDGCRPCSCSPVGSNSAQCDVVSGQCPCVHPHLDGRQCDSCKTGFWNFPICLDCQCNGLAADCHKTTGVCLNCGNNTAGNECQDCQTGYFGDPSRRIACRACACPGGPVQHAVTCQLKSDSPPTEKCNCQRGYIGDNCEACAVNYYGDPTTGDCTRCSCNGNINFSVPNSCDPDTGRCLKCLNQTTGASCEECRPGFYGQAAVGRCQPCTCSSNGTATGARLPNPVRFGNQVIVHACHSKTGQCDCLPNVEGQQCDACKPLHYNLTSQTGCTACDCDPIGSLDGQCDLSTGQCPCRVGRGGRRCNQCQDLYFGDPMQPGQDGCQPCDCHPEGSQTNRCDKVTGRCVCKTAITGRQCDQCERGTTGTLPNCTTCGECWYNWDKLISGLNSTAQALRSQANLTAKRGDFAGDLGNQLAEVDLTLGQIWQALNESRIPGQLIMDVQRKLALLSDDYENKKNVSGREALVISGLARIKNSDLDSMTSQVDRMNQAHLKPKRKMERIRDSLAHPSLLTPLAALDQMRASEAAFNNATTALEAVNGTLDFEAALARRNSRLVAGIVAQAGQIMMSEQNRSDLTSGVYRSVEKMLPELNKEMCVGYEDDKSLYSREKNYCSDMCGGPSPDVCNSTTAAVSQNCADSSVCSKSVVARMRAVETNAVALEARLGAALASNENDTRQLSSLNQTESVSNRNASDTEAKVDSLRSEYESLKAKATQLREEISRFLASNRSTLDIGSLTARIQAASEAFSEAESNRLSDRVKSLLQTVREGQSVSNVMEETREAREKVRDLLRVCNQVVAQAEQFKAAADNITQRLSGAEQSRTAAEALLDQVARKLNATYNSLTQMSSLLESYNSKAGESAAKVDGIRASLAKSQASQLSERIAGLDREQNDTRSALATAGRTLASAAERAAASGTGISAHDMQRRRQQIDNLRQRLASLNLGGDRGQIAKLEETLKNLENSMERASRRLTALLEKLLKDDTDQESLAYMIEGLMSNMCKAAA